jgi:hypothetical protein
MPEPVGKRYGSRVGCLPEGAKLVCVHTLTARGGALVALNYFTRRFTKVRLSKVINSALLSTKKSVLGRVLPSGLLVARPPYAVHYSLGRRRAFGHSALSTYLALW